MRLRFGLVRSNCNQRPYRSTDLVSNLAYCYLATLKLGCIYPRSARVRLKCGVRLTRIVPSPNTIATAEVKDTCSA